MNAQDSRFSELVGTWHLVAEHRTSAEADLGAANYMHDGNGGWVRTSGVEAVSVATEAYGLTLEIADDGTFSESGESLVLLFDAEGVETNGEGFAGRLDVVEERLVAFAGGRVNGPVSAIADSSVLRLSDGSVDIAEFFELSGERLVRTQNVVTDGLYLVSSVLVYDRVPVDRPDSEQSTLVDVDVDVGARFEAEAAVVAALIESAPDGWKELVAYVSADGSLLATLTLAVVCDATGEHGLSQYFDPEPDLDALWKTHRAVAKNDKGKSWGSAVVVIGAEQDAKWEVDYRKSSLKSRQSDERYLRYSKGYLKVFLAENGLER